MIWYLRKLSQRTNPKKRKRISHMISQRTHPKKRKKKSRMI
jgi:hypothetical protein